MGALVSERPRCDHVLRNCLTLKAVSCRFVPTQPGLPGRFRFCWRKPSNLVLHCKAAGCLCFHVLIPARLPGRCGQVEATEPRYTQLQGMPLCSNSAPAPRGLSTSENVSPKPTLTTYQSASDSAREIDTVAGR